MVKGVNKTVIEVQDTGSKVFEKIVFYVSPQYGNLSATQLRDAAARFSGKFDCREDKIALRRRIRTKKKLRLAVFCTLLFVGGLSVLLICKHFY